MITQIKKKISGYSEQQQSREVWGLNDRWWVTVLTIWDECSQLCLLLYEHLITRRQTEVQKTHHALLNDGTIMTAYPSFRLSPTGAGLTDILGWVEKELCDWLLVKDNVSRLTGCIGGVGLLHCECEREPGAAKDKALNSDVLVTTVMFVRRWTDKLNRTSVRSSGARITSRGNFNPICPKL